MNILLCASFVSPWPSGTRRRGSMRMVPLPQLPVPLVVAVLPLLLLPRRPPERLASVVAAAAPQSRPPVVQRSGGGLQPKHQQKCPGSAPMPSVLLVQLAPGMAPPRPRPRPPRPPRWPWCHLFRARPRRPQRRAATETVATVAKDSHRFASQPLPKQ